MEFKVATGFRSIDLEKKKAQTPAKKTVSLAGSRTSKRLGCIRAHKVQGFRFRFRCRFMIMVCVGGLWV